MTHCISPGDQAGRESPFSPSGHCQHHSNSISVLLTSKLSGRVEPVPALPGPRRLPLPPPGWVLPPFRGARRAGRAETWSPAPLRAARTASRATSGQSRSLQGLPPPRQGTCSPPPPGSLRQPSLCLCHKLQGSNSQGGRTRRAGFFFFPICYILTVGSFHFLFFNFKERNGRNRLWYRFLRQVSLTVILFRVKGEERM